MFAGTGGDGGEMVDVDKSWHLIHFLLTGHASGGQWPLGFILTGGQVDGPPEGEDDEDEDGFESEDGSSRTFTPDEVREIAAALTPLTKDLVAARWDPANPEAEQVYLFDDDDELRDYAVTYYGEVRDLVMRLAENGNGLSVSLF